MRGTKWETAVGWGCVLAGIVSVYRIETHANSEWRLVTAASVIGLALLYVKKHLLPNRDGVEKQEQALVKITHTTISPIMGKELSPEVQILSEMEESEDFAARKATKPEGYQFTVWVSREHFAGVGAIVPRRKAEVPLTKSSGKHYHWRGRVSRKAPEESEQRRRARLLFEETGSGEDLEVIH